VGDVEEDTVDEEAELELEDEEEELLDELPPLVEEGFGPVEDDDPGVAWVTTEDGEGSRVLSEEVGDPCKGRLPRAAGPAGIRFFSKRPTSA